MGDWQRTDEALTVVDALRAVDAGAEWVLLWCGRHPTRSGDKQAAEALSVARSEMIDPAERERLFKKGKRKGKMPTVILAERWQNDLGEPLIVFYETGPYLLPDRADPFRF